MNAAVPDCIVDGYEPLIKSIQLPDPDDRHVIAAAIMARANVIVTFNEKDSPPEILDGFRLHTKHPDAFLVDVFSLAPALFLDAVREISHIMEIHRWFTRTTFQVWLGQVFPNWLRSLGPMRC